MMDKVYEVIKQNTDGTTTSWGYYNSERKAQKEVTQMNNRIIRDLMIRANRLNGAIRGKNQEIFYNLIQEAQNLPYTIKTHRVDRGY